MVVLSTHMDTVPPSLPVHEDDTHLYGRGSADAKGIIAAQVAAAERLAEHGERRVALLFVVGEELTADGARAAGTLEPKGRCLINGEPTENRMARGHKGMLRVELRASGRAAHSAYPEEGDSAIEPVLDALESVRRLPLPTDPTLGDCTLNIGTRLHHGGAHGSRARGETGAGGGGGAVPARGVRAVDRRRVKANRALTLCSLRP